MSRFPIAATLVIALAVTAAGGCRRTPTPPAPDTVRMLAGGPISDVFMQEYQKALPGVRITMEPTKGSDFVVTTLEHGIADVGFAQADVVYMTYRAGIADNARQLTELRGMAVGETANVYVAVRRDSPYRTVSDLKNRRIGVFPSATHAQVYARMILAAYGLTSATARLAEFDPGEMSAHLTDGTIDAATFGGPGTRQLAQVNRAVGIRLLELSGEPVTRLRGQYPFFTPVIVTASKLPGQTGDVQTLGVDSLVVCRKDLSDDRVYELTRALFEAAAKAAKTTDAVPIVDPDLGAATPIPLHPGAARYYREREVLQ
jgi:TRAP transporter TAXI family solute receptor